MSGRYCEKHDEWAPTGECRWCEPPPPQVAPQPLLRASFGEPMTMAILMGPPLTETKTEKRTISGAELQQMLNDSG